MRNSWGIRPRNFRGNPVSAILDQHAEDVSAVVRRILIDRYGRLKGGAKLLARDANSSTRAAENWLDGSCTPNAQKLVNVMRHCRELREAIFAMAQEDD